MFLIPVKWGRSRVNSIKASLHKYLQQNVYDLTNKKSLTDFSNWSESPGNYMPFGISVYKNRPDEFSATNEVKGVINWSG